MKYCSNMIVNLLRYGHAERITRVTRLACRLIIVCHKNGSTHLTRLYEARWARPKRIGPRSFSFAPPTRPRSPPSLRCTCCGSSRRAGNPNAVVFGCMTSSVGAHSWVGFTTSSRNSAWMTAGSRRIFGWLGHVWWPASPGWGQDLPSGHQLQALLISCGASVLRLSASDVGSSSTLIGYRG